MVKLKEEVISTTEKPVFYWQATEFESHQKSRGWSAYVIIAAIILIAAFIWQKLYLAGGVTIAAVLAIYSQAHSSGKKKNYAIYNQGVTINEKIFAFDQFKSFWIFPYQERIIVRFEQVKRLSLPLEMPIEEENAEQVRLFLSKHLPEQEEKGEDITDTINRWIKF
ncbi:MAG: hypothetical protein NTW79_01725 [Candidatus Berkelbacteria bacterium]|nr:hypothetical protein [Candidatus Berkelbacteria bacterium]